MKKIFLFLFTIILAFFLIGCTSSDNSEPFIKGISDVANMNKSEESEEVRRSEIVEEQDPFGVQRSQSINNNN